MEFTIKVIVSALVIALASEVSKKSDILSALIISLPISSIIAICFYYNQSGSLKEVATYVTSILYLVIPSLIFFLLLPVLLNYGINFYLSLFTSCLITGLSYLLFIKITGIKI
ncbi:MAG: DUF3147 family protein [Rickettsiales bacterium]|nr:DUF3147 family protein [Rickettsiales bacterium]